MRTPLTSIKNSVDLVLLWKTGDINENQELFLSFAKKKAGSGLGLAICKYTVEANGGKTCCTSEENKGSTFDFTLPYRLTKKN
jgi:signal transduction histidine kinase